ncbi:MAG: UDP-glucose 4-epimerase [Thermoprotei archaeon]|nr:MAG: UDP-glucose 4-epimerase [Thermoprotei archaeon]
MKVVVTGGAGFIGSHLVEELVRKGYEVLIIDNLSSGRLSNIAHLLHNDSVNFAEYDLKIFNDKLVSLMRGTDIVYHLAANPEVRVSVTEPRVHFNENILTTFNVLEACRLCGIKYVVFASSSTVYGDVELFPTPETHPLNPISVYGAAKLASEELVRVYSTLYGIRSLILRLANIVGPRQSHGVIIDFIKKLRKNAKQLEILGDGTQRKSYLHVTDLVRAVNYALNHFMKTSKPFEVFNVGNNDWITVKEIADIVVSEMGLRDVKYLFKPATRDGRGWVGDVKFMLLDISKLRKIGWEPLMSSAQAVRETARSLVRGDTH